jgi:hypothetical protein
LEVLNSPTSEQSILALEEDAAQGVLDIIQHVRVSGDLLDSDDLTIPSA